MGRFSNSMQLFKTSWGVLKLDKELALIPVVSAVISALVMGAMGVGAWLTVKQVPTTTRDAFDGTVSTTSTVQPSPATYVIFFVGAFLLSIVVVFFTGALMAGAHERLSGGNPSLGSAFGKAASRFPQLLGWAVINATVGMVLRAIADRGGIFGQIAASLLGMAWNVVSWLAIPFVVIGEEGPIQALKSSATALKRTWGENLIAQAGFGLIGFLFYLPGIAIAVALGAASSTLIPVAIIFGVVYLAIVATILSALTGIYRTALYMYAANGYVPAGFDQQVLAGAFRTKTSRLGLA